MTSAKSRPTILLQPCALVRTAWIILLTLGTLSCHKSTIEDSVRWVPDTKGKKLYYVSHVDGIRQALSNTEEPVRVLMVHGMITKNPNYSATFQTAVGEQLQLTRGMQYPVKYMARGYDFEVSSGPQPFATGRQLSELRKTSWLDSKGNERLVFYEVLWSPLRDALKRQFFSCYESRLASDCDQTTDVNRATDHRSSINSSIKDDIMVNGFADAMLVVSPLGDVFRDDMSQAMCIIATDALQANGFKVSVSDSRCDILKSVPHEEDWQRVGLALEKTKLFTITHSLGSFLIVDAHQQYARTYPSISNKSNRRSAAEQTDSFLFTLTDHSTVFMLANQIALLQLTRLKALCWKDESTSTCPNRFLPQADIFSREDALGQLRTYVAFNDSDDLLGFDLQPYLSEMGIFGALINVSVSNRGFSIPWLFKSPESAHTMHFENPAVVEAIVEGFKIH